MLRPLAAFALAVGLFSGCGPSKPADSPEGTAKEEAKPEEAKPEEAAQKPDEAKPDEAAQKPEEAAQKPAAEPAKAQSEFDVLARDLAKGGGRRIGWSATKKSFAIPSEKRNDASFGLDIQFMAEDGAVKDPMRICQMGECEEHLDELLKDLLPKLASKLEGDGYVALRGIGWPDGSDELPVSSLNGKLRWLKGGRVELVREGKPAAGLTVVSGGGRLDAEALRAIFLVPDSKLVGVFVTPAKKTGVVQTFHVLKLP
jgi:hypothetical protein